MEQNLEDKLNTILSDPGMMQKIQAMAQSLGQSAAKTPQEESPSAPGIDLDMLQKISSLGGQTAIDNNQKALLCALSPYLSQSKVSKLEKAMRAAKMARMASGFLGNGGLQIFSGR